MMTVRLMPLLLVGFAATWVVATPLHSSAISGRDFSDPQRTKMATEMTAPPVARAVFPWLCLERCGDNSSAIDYQLAQLRANKSVFTGAAWEDYNLGPNVTLVKNNLTQIASRMAELGFADRWAMVSSYPYPPQFLTWMRQVFADPVPFINACLDAIRSEMLTGFNIDWEPTSGGGAPDPTEEDAQAYAAFLDRFSRALHSAGPYQVSVAVATWSEIWNLTALAGTAVDYIATMSTYTGNLTTWEAQFAHARQAIPLSKLVIGLETVNTEVISTSSFLLIVIDHFG